MMKKRNRVKCLVSVALACGFLFLTGCGKTAQAPVEDDAATMAQEAFVDTVAVDVIEDEYVPLAAAPIPAGMMPQASGTAVQKNNKAIIDYSNTTDGYVMVQFSAATAKRLKTQVQGPSGVTYTYNIVAGIYETLPLSDGNGSYKVTVFENVEGSSYATVVSASFSVAMTDEFAPFVRPNQYVNYTTESKIVAEAARITAGASSPLAKVEKVYDYVVENLTYDTNKAKTVKSGYLPVLDTVLAQKKGICFDYASLMTGMLRSQGVATKLVVGYSNDVYHAWINVYTPETGWVDGAVFFDGVQWQLMDPTFASSAKKSKQIMEYIGNGANYSAKYMY